MARIYNPNPNQSSFQGSAQGGRFFAEQAVNTTKQAKEKMNRELRDIDTLAKSDQRRFNVENSFRQAQNTTTQGGIQILGQLASFSKTAFNAVEDSKKEAEELRIEDDNLRFLGLDAAEPGASKNDFDQADEIDNAINIQSTATDQTATEVESDGDILNISVGNSLRQKSAARIAAPIKGNLMAARANYPAYMQESLNNIPDDVRPRNLGEAQDLLRSINKQFFRDAGLLGTANRKLVARHLAEFMLGTTINLTTQLVSAGIKADQKANLTQLTSQVYNSVASTAPAADVWKFTSEGMAHNNVGYKGRTPASNEASMVLITTQAISAGDVTLLENLRGTPKIEGQPNGPKLGDEYAHILEPAIEQAKQKRTSAITTQRQATNQEAKAAVTAYYSDPTKKDAKQTLIRQLQGLPQTTAVRAELDSLMSAGFGNDPELEAELTRQQAAEKFIPQDVLNDALNGGRIRPEVHQALAARNPDIQVNTKARQAVKDKKDFVRSKILAGKRLSDMPKVTRAAFEERVIVAMDTISQQLAAEVRSDSEILDNPSETTRLLNDVAISVLERPEFQLLMDPKNGLSFAADLGKDRSPQFKKITIAPGEQDFRDQDFTEMTTKIPRSEFSATDDLILDADQLNTDVNNLIQDKEISPSSSKWARWLGLSDRAFIDAQLERNGKPSIRLLRSQSPKAVEPGADLTPVSGFKYLRDLGFSRRGCAYLTSAISHESAWNGMREWKEVEGDGTNRNGGLISWASWHNNAARLGAIEAHFGRSIGSITETEQLEYMHLEMKNDYPEADAIFRNPNASSADLQWAVNNYWGFDPKYTGDRWVDAENMINAQ